MKTRHRTSWTIAALALIGLSGCASKTVVVPKTAHSHHGYVNHHVIYHRKPAHKHCWRHRGHWHCR